MNNYYNKTVVYKLKCSDHNKLYNGQIDKSFATRYNEHIKEINQPYIKSNSTEHICSKGHKYTN